MAMAEVTRYKTRETAVGLAVLGMNVSGAECGGFYVSITYTKKNAATLLCETCRAEEKVKLKGGRVAGPDLDAIRDAARRMQRDGGNWRP